MNPTNYDVLLRKMCNDTGLDYQRASDIINFYWGEVKQTLIDCEHDNVFIQAFGSMKAKPKIVREKINAYIDMIKYLPNNSIRNAGAINAIRQRKVVMEGMMKMIKAEAERKRLHFLTRYENENI